MFAILRRREKKRVFHRAPVRILQIYKTVQYMTVISSWMCSYSELSIINCPLLFSFDSVTAAELLLLRPVVDQCPVLFLDELQAYFEHLNGQHFTIWIIQRRLKRMGLKVKKVCVWKVNENKFLNFQHAICRRSLHDKYLGFRRFMFAPLPLIFRGLQGSPLTIFRWGGHSQGIINLRLVDQSILKP